MEKISTNPLKSLTLDELNEFIITYEGNFKFLEVEEVKIKNSKGRWWQIYYDCVQYAYWNNETIEVIIDKEIELRK